MHGWQGCKYELRSCLSVSSVGSALGNPRCEAEEAWDLVSHLVSVTVTHSLLCPSFSQVCFDINEIFNVNGGSYLEWT